MITSAKLAYLRNIVFNLFYSYFLTFLELIMTLVKKAVQILVNHGFNAIESTGYGGLIVVKFPDTKIILHHFDVYEFLNKHHKQAV